MIDNLGMSLAILLGAASAICYVGATIAALVLRVAAAVLAILAVGIALGAALPYYP